MTSPITRTCASRIRARISCTREASSGRGRPLSPCASRSVDGCSCESTVSAPPTGLEVPHVQGASVHREQLVLEVHRDTDVIRNDAHTLADLRRPGAPREVEDAVFLR